MNVCIVDNTDPMSTTFIRLQCEQFPANVFALYGQTAHFQGRPIPYKSLTFRIKRLITKPMPDRETCSYAAAFRKYRADVAVAQFGPAGVRIMNACRLVKIPLVVHFRGYDASIDSVLEKHQSSYPQMFKSADALIAVSRQIEQWLLSSGAHRNKVHYNPSGVDCDRFQGSEPDRSDVQFLFVGRFVEKKAPHLLLLSFKQVLDQCPSARLRMVGDGPLLGLCRDLAMALKIDYAVTFLGVLGHDDVCAEMKRCRALVQHSLRATNGDCEGTPNAIMEAGASGLPVVSTRHAGIPDVVVEGATGFLVDERDIEGMASHMLTLAQNPNLAAKMGQAARLRIIDHFSMQRSINRAWEIIESCVKRPRE